MKQFKRFFSSVNNSIFFETTIILGTLCFLIVIYLMAFAFRPIIKSEQEKNKLLYENALTSAQTIVDYSLLNIHDIITKTSQENCILNTIVSPESGSDDSEILLSLSNLKGTSELIKEAFLFIPENDKVYTSKYTLINRSDFYEKNVIDSYYSNSDSLDYISQNGRISKFFIINSKIFIVRDFPLEGENRLGTFFIKIDVDKFFKTLKINETISPNHLYIYSSNGTPLFQNELDYTDRIDTYLGAMSDSKNNTKIIDNKLCMYNNSDVTHFKYLLVVDSITESNLGVIIALIFPVIIICLVMAFFVSTKILMPIKNLIFIADTMRLAGFRLPDSANYSSTSGDISNNMRYLNASFVKALSSINYLNDLLKKLQPDISDIIFKDLLTGKPMPADDIDNILTNIDSRIKGEGLYNVMVLNIEKPGFPHLIKNYLSAIENILNIKTKDFCSYQLQTIDSFVYAIIFQFNNSSAYSIKIFEKDLKNMLINTSSYLQVATTIGTGKICKSIQDIHFSFDDALNPIYLESDNSDDTDSDERETYYSKTYFYEHAQKLFEFVKNDDESSAMLFASQLSTSIRDGNYSLDEIRLYYSTYVESVLNKLLDFKNINLDANILFNIKTILIQTEDLTTMKNAIDAFIEDAISLASDRYKKHNHPYIIKAENHIKNHYSDPSLSLSDIAEKLGTNSTYLSKLFKENLGVNFNDYINSYRIEIAKSLLNSTDKKIEVISNETGFNSQQNFIRVFKKIEGLAPGQYRKSKQI